MTDTRKNHDAETPHVASASESEPEPTPKPADDRQEELLDEGIEETFPASDPVSVKRIT